MKLHIRFLLLLPTFSSILSQHLAGVYEAEFERLEFSEDTLYFSIGSDGGLIIPIVGYGPYAILDSFLVVENQNSPELLTKFNSHLNDPVIHPEFIVYANQKHTIFFIKQIKTCYFICELLTIEFEGRNNMLKALKKLYKKQNRNAYCKGRERLYAKPGCT